ncbi:MAG: FAD-dependent oxidoreductase, partial [Pseudomonadota bacterium]
MNLHSDYPFWMISEGLKHSFPTLLENLTTDVLVIGGGITGALISHKLCKAGLQVTLVEKQHVAHGSTSASTAMLQYEIDTPLFKLSKKSGEQNAQRAYALCLEAIAKIETICEKFPDKADFERHPSLWYATYKKHVKEILEPELKARRQMGIAVRLVSEKNIQDNFGFSAPAGLLSEDAAQVNPYLMTNFLLEEVAAMGGRIHELTEIVQLTTSDRSVTVETKNGHKIKARYVVMAAGYESQKFLDTNFSRVHSSYAIISKPLPRKNQWYKNSLIWETTTPYHYLRTTGDNRIIVGGRDENFYSPDKRDRLISRKSTELLQKFNKLFPEIPFETDFAWAGTFSETKDGLPYIGPYDHKRILFAMGYGGNGITFSVIAAEILTDLIQGKKNTDAHIFAFA